MKKLSLLTAAAIVTITLTACAQGKQKPSFVSGPVTATGVLLSTDVSLHRRGTHVLFIGGKPQWYVESKSVNLRSYEGMIVGIDGVLEQNTDPRDPPVLVAEKLTRSVKTGDMTQRTLPSVGLSLALPTEWRVAESSDGVSVSLPSDALPILSLHAASGSSLPPGESFFVRNHPATRTKSASGIQEVAISLGSRIVLLSFDPTNGNKKTSEELALLTLTFDRIIASIDVPSSAASRSSSAPRTPTGTNNTTCGGIAGVLCPSGSYCEITNAAEGLGTCTPLTQAISSSTTN